MLAGTHNNSFSFILKVTIHPYPKRRGKEGHGKQSGEQDPGKHYSNITPFETNVFYTKPGQKTTLIFRSLFLDFNEAS